MDHCYIVGIRVNHRVANAGKLQDLLTKYGCNIKLRVGLHETNENYCSDDGIIMLQVCGEKDKLEGMSPRWTPWTASAPKCSTWTDESPSWARGLSGGAFLYLQAN